MRAGELAAQVGYNRGDAEDEGERSMAADDGACSSRNDSRLRVGRPSGSDTDRLETLDGCFGFLHIFEHRFPLFKLLFWCLEFFM